MPLRSAAALLALLLVASAGSVAFAATAGVAAPPKHAAPAAKPAAAADPTLALIDQVTERYLTLQQYQMTGRFTARITGGKLDGNVVEVPFFYAAVRPGKLRNDLRNPVMTTLVVSNGDSLQMYVPGLHQYTRQPAPSVLPGGASNDAFTRSLDPLLAYALRAPGQPFASARSLGRDTVHVESGTIDCERIEITSFPDTSHPELRVLPRVVWVDPVQRLVLRDSVTLDVDHPQLGHLRQVLDTHFSVTDLTSGGPDSLYALRVPASAQRVARIGAPGMDPPDLGGQDAKDFTLENLLGKPVKLSALKGKVVVLDFWATWCGPCRRWLPIVAKAHHALAKQGVRIFAVNLRESTAQVKRYLLENKLDVPVLMDRSSRVGIDYGATSIPLTVVIGKDGRIVKSMVGLHAEADLRGALAEAGITWK